MPDYDAIVIGGGQAGLAMGYYLQQQGLRFTILDKRGRVGESWRERYDSLVLFTPRRFNDLPGLPFPGQRDGLPDKNEAADYLENYAHHFGLPIQPGAEVSSLEQTEEGFRIYTQARTYQARTVVVATGPFHTPYVPTDHMNVDYDVTQWHTATYRNEQQLSNEPVLVVGGGNSGVQIAVELARDRPVMLSMGRTGPFLPRSILGKTIFAYMRALGILTVPASSWLGRLYRSLPDPIFGYGNELRQMQKAGKLRIVPRLTSFSGRVATFADGSTETFSQIVWATGYRPDYHWLDIPDVLDELGRPHHRRGVSPIPGLFFLGLPWQRNRQSALIGGVGHDARLLADEIAAFLRG